VKPGASQPRSSLFNCCAAREGGEEVIVVEEFTGTGVFQRFGLSGEINVTGQIA
jgi:hypothetical protein